MEPLQAKSLDDIGALPVRVFIPRPDGQVVFVFLYALTYEELWEILRTTPTIPPPVQDIQRVNGKVTTIYNYDDPAYVLAVKDSNRNFSARCLVRMLTGLDIPGDTEEARVNNFQSKVGSYAFQILLREANHINNVEEDEARRLADSFRGEREAGGADYAGASSDTGSVVELVEAGAGIPADGRNSARE